MTTANATLAECLRYYLLVMFMGGGASGGVTNTFEPSPWYLRWHRHAGGMTISTFNLNSTRVAGRQ